MLRWLRGIQERRRPCLEACLRFLLFGDEDERVGIGIPRGIDSESSNEEEGNGERKGEGGRKSRDFTVSLLRNNKNHEPHKVSLDRTVGNLSGHRQFMLKIDQENSYVSSVRLPG